MKQTADVVVIGAGIQGMSVAYHLAKLGIQDVVCCRKSFRWCRVITLVGFHVDVAGVVGMADAVLLDLL